MKSTTESTIPQNNQKKPKKQKVVMIDDKWWNFKTKSYDFMTNTKLDRLADEIVDWAEKNEDAIKINQFLQKEGIGPKTWFDWYTKYEPLARAHAYAKMIIGNRREHGMLTRKFETHSCGFMMPHYDPDWDAMMVRKEELKKKNDVPTGQQFVVIEKFADSPLVPNRKNSE